MREYRLDELYELQMGKTPSRDNLEYWEEGGCPWVSIADLTKSGRYVKDTKEKITEKAVIESGIKLVPQNTLIMSFKLTIGRVAITEKPMYTNEAIMAFIDKKIEEIDTRYAYYLFTAQNWLKGTNRAVMGATLNKATLSCFKIKIHSSVEQEEIRKKLDNITLLIKKRKEQLSEIDNLVKSQFIEMFGDVESNPHNYPSEKLQKHLDVVGGYAFKSDEFKESGVPVLRIGNINAGFFKDTNLVYWEEDNSLERYLLYPGDLVISLTGTVGKDDYANVCILGKEFEKYYLNQRNAKLLLKKNIDKYYVSYLLKFPAIKSKLTGISRGVRQANVANRDIENLIVPIPPIELQNKFARFVEQTDKSKFPCLMQEKMLKKLYFSLINTKTIVKKSQKSYNRRKEAVI